MIVTKTTKVVSTTVKIEGGKRTVSRTTVEGVDTSGLEAAVDGLQGAVEKLSDEAEKLAEQAEKMARDKESP